MQSESAFELLGRMYVQRDLETGRTLRTVDGKILGTMDLVNGLYRICIAKNY
jgi:hypothetical protein